MSTAYERAARVRRSTRRLALAWPALALVLVTGVNGPMPAPAATFVVNITADTGDTNVTDGLCRDIAGNCSLRAAISQANALAGAHRIEFNIAGAGPHTIRPASGLPTISRSVTIDGFTQPGSQSNSLPTAINAVLRVELDGSLVPPPTPTGLAFSSASNVVRGLAVNRFGGAGMVFFNATGGSVVEGNFIGTDAGGSNAVGNGLAGVLIDSSPNNRVGGPSPGARNLISGNGLYGVEIVGVPGIAPARSNVVQGNFIGTDVTGTIGFGNGSDGVHVHGAGATVVGGDAPGAGNLISGNGEDGVDLHVSGAASNVVQGNLIGTSITGDFAVPNGAHGIIVRLDATNNFIGGPTAAARNVISGNRGNGILLDTNVHANTVQGNFIGTDATGTNALPNGTAGDGQRGSGIMIAQSRRNLIGGPGEGAGNVISGNLNHGLFIRGPNAGSNVVEGNLIGTDVHGTNRLGNGSNFVPGAGIGVFLDGASGNLIGSTANPPASGNVISANSLHGVRIRGLQAKGNRVEANRIGLSRAGDAALGNGSPTVTGDANGIFIENAPSNTIGGLTLNAGNIISANEAHGIGVTGSNAVGNVIQGNFVGTDATGMLTDPNGTPNDGDELGNAGNGINLDDAPATRVGGPQADARNVISGNRIHGVRLGGSEGHTRDTVVQGNFIGVTAAGTNVLPNGTVIGAGIGDGIFLENVSTNLIGGTNDPLNDLRAGNVISGNLGHGVEITGAAAAGNLILGNFIGTDLTATQMVGNVKSGVRVQDAGATTIGRTIAGSGNVIAANGTNGIVIATGLSNAIRGNLIFSNNFFGIDLADDGATFNDLGDGDAGANRRQNFPLLTRAEASLTNLVIRGFLNSAPSGVFALDFFSNIACDPSGQGEGQEYFGSALVTNNAAGNVVFIASFAVVVSPGRLITVTATDADDNTSEFSPCRVVTPNTNGPPDLAADLAVPQSDLPDPVAQNNDLTYTLLVVNQGPDAASDILLTNALPAGAVFVALTNSQGNCTATNGTVTCDLGLLAPQASATIRVQVRPTMTGVLTNRASVAATELDPNPADNFSQESTTVIPNDPPLLTAALSGGVLDLRWPASASSYRLERTPDLNPPIVWTVITNPVVTVGGQNRVLIIPGDGFYRLRAELP